MPDEKLLAWGERVRDLVEEAENLMLRFRAVGPPPNTGGSPSDRLNALLAVWSALVDDQADNPASSRAARFTQVVTQQTKAVAHSFENCLLSIEQDIYSLLATNAFPSDQWISVGEFGVGGVGSLRRGAGFLAVAPLNVLPVAHPYRTLIALDDLPKFDGDTHSIILGPMRASTFGHAIPRGWYSVRQARYFSKLLADEQREEKRKREEERKRQELNQARAAAHDPHVRADLLSRQVEELQREVAAVRQQKREAALTMEMEPAEE
jgi:hypothetical protein